MIQRCLNVARRGVLVCTLGYLLVSLSLIAWYPERFTYYRLPPGQATYQLEDVPTVDPWFRDEQRVGVIGHGQVNPARPIKNRIWWAGMLLLVSEVAFIGPKNVFDNINDKVRRLASV